MNDPIDQPERDRFIRELDQNFSVVASAGSGKTRAITDRIIAIATSDRACEWLPTLVVVTFTNRAADEMQQRARQRILEAGVSLDVLAAFSRAFFGTIHSFCLRLLQRYGHHLGLTGELTLLTDDAALWQEFVQQRGGISAGLPKTQRECLFRLAPVRRLMELGRYGCPADAALADPGEFPGFDFAQVLAFRGRDHATANIEAAQAALREWQRRWEQGDGFAELPHTTKGGAEFLTLYAAALAPLREWLRCCSLRVAREIATAYQDFRLARGAMTYDDQVRLASALLREPEAARRIRAQNYRVILDEAQDTDPEQFETLLETTRPIDAAGLWIESAGDPPRSGHFSMVGDFQQAIFGERADLSFYRRVHQALLRNGAGEELKFSVTFRLDDAPIEFVNTAFADVLNNEGGQVSFVRLQARPQSLPGQVLRLDLSPPAEADDWTDRQRAHFEAEKIAAWLRAQSREQLRVQSWRDVAILCPRKSWFAPLKDALRRQGFDVQLQSERDVKGDSPACAWLSALMAIMVEPANGYEIVGVLREVFGISDHDLATFAAGMWDGFVTRRSEGGMFQPTGLTAYKAVPHCGRQCWQIASLTPGHGPVAETLNALFEIRARIVALPLFSAVEELVRGVKLRERLRCLPIEEFDEPDADLDELLTLAASAEARACTLADFAAELRASFTTIREVRSNTRDAVQLITCHKAKGSEWRTVIVPFLGRGITQRSRAYPRLLRDPANGRIVAALDKTHLDDLVKAAIETQQRQELERLLYVTLSRAKHTLVVVDDRSLFTKRNKNASSQLLRCIEGTATCAHLEALPTTAAPCARTMAQGRTASVHRGVEQASLALGSPDGKMLICARDRAAQFRKRNPSALAEIAFAASDRGSDTELTSRNAIGPTAGARYGTWWHDFAEGLDWRAGAAVWDAHFAEMLEVSPDPDLSRDQWALFRAQLSSGSELATLLSTRNAIAHAEMPFLWAINDRDLIEGVIDLAVFDATRGQWLIVDWKTNRTRRKALPGLRDHYLPQLSAYWKAVTFMRGAPAVAGLYSTATGAWLPYETAELSAAWDALEGSSAALAEALSEP